MKQSWALALGFCALLAGLVTQVRYYQAAHGGPGPYFLTLAFWLLLLATRPNRTRTRSRFWSYYQYPLYRVARVIASILAFFGVLLLLRYVYLEYYGPLFRAIDDSATHNG